MKGRTLSGLAMCLFVALAAGPADAQKIPMKLSDWQIQSLPKVDRPTTWSEVEMDGEIVLRAVADRSASGLIQALEQEPGRLSWRWKISRTVRGSDIYKKSGDDYSARVYVFFDPPTSQLSLADRAKLAIGRKLFGNALPRAALCYVWSQNAEVGQIIPNAYTDRVQMIVLDQGDAHAGQWRTHERDVAKDYVAAFDQSPAPAVTGISLMSDTDNTGDSVSAWFGSLSWQVPDGAKRGRSDSHGGR